MVKPCLINVSAQWNKKTFDKQLGPQLHRYVISALGVECAYSSALLFRWIDVFKRVSEMDWHDIQGRLGMNPDSPQPCSESVFM